MLGGYVTANGTVLFIHICDKKAILIDLEKVLKDRKGIYLKGISLFEVRLLTRCGFLNFSLTNLLIILKIINEQVAPIVCDKHPHLKIVNDLVVSDGNSISCAIKIGAFINLFTVFNIIFITIIKRMVKNVKGKK